MADTKVSDLTPSDAQLVDWVEVYRETASTAEIRVPIGVPSYQAVTAAAAQAGYAITRTSRDILVELTQDLTAAATFTLPASPIDGDIVRVVRNADGFFDFSNAATSTTLGRRNDYVIFQRGSGLWKVVRRLAVDATAIEPKPPVLVTTTPRLLTDDERYEDQLWVVADAGSGTILLPKASAAGSLWVIVNGTTAAKTISIESDAGTFNGAAGGSTQIAAGIGNTVVARYIANAGSAPTAQVLGDTTDTRQMLANLNAAGFGIYGNRAGTTSASGNLSNTSHSGKIVNTTGDVTVPQTAGFNVTLVAGGAHKVTFGATMSPAMAAGDMMSIVIDNNVAIQAVLTATADKVAFS